MSDDWSLYIIAYTGLYTLAGV